jgi:hypothetical protein
LYIVTTTHLATNLCNKSKIRATATAAVVVAAAAAAAAAVVAAAAVAAVVAVAAAKRIPTAQVVVVAAAAAAAVVKKLPKPTEGSHESLKKMPMNPAVLQMKADLRIQD